MLFLDTIWPIVNEEDIYDDNKDDNNNNNDIIMDLVRHISFSFVINHNFVLQIRKLIIGRAINAEYR